MSQSTMIAPQAISDATPAANREILPHETEMELMMPVPVYVQRKCACDDEDEPLQRQSMAPFTETVSAGAERQINESRGGGHRLDAHTRSFMESRFDADFSEVRIHTGQQAAQLSQDLHAAAFTVGKDIYFNEGRFAPNTADGRHLLAHELTHTLQQPAATPAIQRRTIPQDYATAAFETGPIWDVHLVITGAPEGARENVTDFISACQDGIMAAARALGTHPAGASRRIRVRIPYRAIRPNSTDYADTEQEAYRLALASVPGAVQPTPTPTPPRPAPGPAPAAPGAITVVPCASFPVTIGSRGGCGTGDDATTAYFPLSAVPPALLPSALSQDSMPDFSLRLLPQGVLTTFAGSDGYSLFSDFYNSSASSRTFAAGSDVATRAQAHASFVAARASVEHELAANLASQAVTNTISCGSITLATLPVISFSGSADMKLWTLIGGTQGLVVELTGITILPYTRNFIADVRFNICDDFGVDVSDLSRTGFSGSILNELLLPFWILQHRRSGHTPLIVNVVLEEHISGAY
ncbi:eCIS core domain-containing protein [Chitinophaga vietnamensis]|uniref:eCIS core domain-containing protein n=1 Tax=Chitinophaga vietnamensis TaxID=2593957 RepID=UPI0011789394|nr:DUF4157 domain-containing protein [Chitinophaga vietnamensis]